MLTGPEKARENWLRRLAERREGMRLSRTRRRDRRASDYGTYRLIPDPEHPRWIDAHEDDLQPVWLNSLDEIERYLLGEELAQEQVERLLAHEGLTIERAVNEASGAQMIWLSSEKDDRKCGPFYSFDEVESWLRAPREQKPAREWSRMSGAS